MYIWCICIQIMNWYTKYTCTYHEIACACLRQIASEAITSKCWQLQEDIQETNISLGSWMHRSNSIIMNLSLLNKNLITGCNLRVSSSPQKVFGEKFGAIILLSSELVVPLWRDYDVHQASFSFLFLVWLGITGRYGCGWIIRIMIIYNDNKESEYG